ncbi:hypothetical protein [Pseudorhodoferax sp.]|uniref:hypothetical protein n=1 Tax=Pseudorhodoferax sp. TaxID=1993553 RepID=UPI0039E500E7
MATLKGGQARVAGRWVASVVMALPLACTLAVAGQALAQSEPSLDQVYQAAHGGHVDDALQMMAPVLRDHPRSAKAHYVEAELLAQQGRLGPAQAELAMAERLAPGLPFVQDASLQHLHQVLDRQTSVPAAALPSLPAASPAHGRTAAWGLLIAVAFGALLGWLLTRVGRPRAVPPAAATSMVVSPLGASGAAWPRAAGPVGAGAMPMPAGTALGWGSQVPAGATPGWGSQVAAGVAGGLAAGAAAVAGQELAHRLFSHGTPIGSETVGAAAAQPVAPAGWADDPDFGVRDDGGWNDGRSTSAADAGGWDDDRDDGGMGGNWSV